LLCGRKKHDRDSGGNDCENEKKTKKKTHVHRSRPDGTNNSASSFPHLLRAVRAAPLTALVVQAQGMPTRVPPFDPMKKDGGVWSLSKTGVPPATQNQLPKVFQAPPSSAATEKS
jgi:hypothetical protein